jgi:outer membrane protein TolC
VVESERAVRLYQTNILPSAGANVLAAQSAYVTGKIPFVSLLEAQRNQVSLQERSLEARAEYHRRRAALERAIGGSLPPPK